MNENENDDNKNREQSISVSFDQFMDTAGQLEEEDN